jgi:hypothetical protein
MGEAGRDALRVAFDRTVKLEFHGATVSSNAGLLPYRDLDDAVQLTESAGADLLDFHTGRNIQHSMTALLRRSVYSRLAGYEDVYDAKAAQWRAKLDEANPVQDESQEVVKSGDLRRTAFVDSSPHQ